MPSPLLGQDFVPPDIVAKVTGSAKFVDDIHVAGMLTARLLLSPHPHARVTAIRIPEALAGVVAVLTPADLPQRPVGANPLLTDEPTFVGAPILAVAALDEASAAAALDAIEVSYDLRPFTTDPLGSLAPDGVDARAEGNVGAAAGEIKRIKWDQAVFTEAGDGRLPDGPFLSTWEYGDVEAGFRNAKVVVDESFVTASVPHHTLETHAALAYWQNGKCIVHGSAQSHTFLIPQLAQLIGIEPENLVFVGPYCGGGFGSKGGAYPMMALPAWLARKAGRPVMLRLSRAEEYFLGFARHGFQGRIKMGFDADGRMLAADIAIVQDNGGVVGAADYRSAGELVAVLYSPIAMRWRGLPVFTNTPPCSAMRGPGQNQTSAAVEPVLDKAARLLGIDRVALRRINAPETGTTFGPARDTITSAYLKDALDRGAQLFRWRERVKASGHRRNGKVTGVGVGQGFHSAGFNGFDGLVCITPDGKLHVHTGVGNLGTYSYAVTARAAADVLGVAAENLVIERGDSRLGLPWNSVQAGSSTIFAETRTNFVAAEDAKRKLLDIAARTLGGSALDYQLSQEKVVAKNDPARAMTFAQAARAAIAAGGEFCGRTLPDDLHPITRQAATLVAGTGLVGVAKDRFAKDGLVAGLCAAFAEVEIDCDTGERLI
jgi:CO/xanthine dehydrogenase Mo-binding subunit